jgi:hypothetical protein
MDTNTELLSGQDIAVETERSSDTVELSLPELDMVGGGSIGYIF